MSVYDFKYVMDIHVTRMCFNKLRILINLRNIGLSLL